jgi:CrcB protein
VLSELGRLLLIAAAGAVGTLSRYGLAFVVQRWCGAGFPWGTLAVNVSGCFLFGLVWTFAEDRLLISPATRIIVLVGFMGAFTTFSTFAYETAEFLRDAQWLLAAANVIAQNFIGVAAVILGFAVGRSI